MRKMKWYEVKEAFEFFLPWIMVFSLVGALVLQQERHEETLTELVLGTPIMTAAELEALPICTEGMFNDGEEEGHQQGIPSRTEIREGLRSIEAEANKTASQ